MNQNLTLATFQSAIQFVKEQYSQRAALVSLGLSADDMSILTQHSAWVGTNRAQVQKTIKALSEGMASAIGYMPFKVPAEYIAALIAGFVSAGNVYTACAWTAEGLIPASDIAAGNAAIGAAEPVSAQQLFSLFLQARTLDSSFATGFAANFNSKVRKQEILAKQTPKEVDNG